MRDSVPYSGTGVKTVAKALTLLVAFERRSEWGVTELSRELGMPKSVIHRLVSTLVDHRFLEQRGDRGTYVLGMRISSLARQAAQQTTLGSRGHRHLEQLARDADDAAFLTMLRGDRYLCVDVVDFAAHIRSAQQIGDTMSLHAGAGGKVILAFLDEARIEELLSRPLMRYTESTTVDPDRLRAELAEIRSRGWALSVGEVTPGSAAVAAPVRDHGGQVVAGVNVTTTALRMDAERVALLQDLTMETGRALSRDLGYVPTQYAVTD